jgi:Protein of unknown function (DUF3558)
VAALVVAALTTGCTTTSTGEPEPVANKPSAMEPSSADVDALPDGVPEVDTPLDTARFQQNPCLALTADQTRQLNVGPSGEPVKTALGNACDWRNAETRGFAEIAFLEKSTRGLSAAYEANSDGKWAFFEELPTIEGYPAVAYGGVDSRDVGACSVLVGVSDQLVFESAVRLSEANIGQKDPCEVAVEVAGMALRTMKAGR